MKTIVIFFIFNLSFATAEPLELIVGENSTDTKYLTINNGTKIKAWGDPIQFEILGTTKDLKLEVTPIFPKGTFDFEIVYGDRWKCTPVEEDPKTEIRKNDHIAYKTVDLKTKDDKQVGTLSDFYVYQSSALEYMASLTVAKQKTDIKLKLKKPLVIAPFLKHVLKYAVPKGKGFVSNTFPPKTMFLNQDNCGEQFVENKVFPNKIVTNPGRYKPRNNKLFLIDSIGSKKVYFYENWIFILSKDIKSLDYSKVKENQMTYLGDRYWLDIAKSIKNEKKLKIIMATGEFSGCWGAGCGETVNNKLIMISVLKNGDMSTKFRRLSRQEYYDLSSDKFPKSVLKL